MNPMLDTMFKKMQLHKFLFSFSKNGNKINFLYKVTEPFKAIKKIINSRKGYRIMIKVLAVLIPVAILAETIYQWNVFHHQDAYVYEYRANLNLEYRRRNNLILNLITAVEKYAVYEQNIFQYISDARNALQIANNSDIPKENSDMQLKGVLGRLMAIAEQYPDLKATQSLEDVITGIITTENRIVEAKKKYNKEVEIYNQYLTIFPGNIFGNYFFRLKYYSFAGIDDEKNKRALIKLDLLDSPEKNKEIKTEPVKSGPLKEILKSIKETKN